MAESATSLPYGAKSFSPSAFIIGAAAAPLFSSSIFINDCDCAAAFAKASFLAAAIFPDNSAKSAGDSYARISE